MNRRVYFAHSMDDYGSSAETKAIDKIKALFPNWQIVNPAICESHKISFYLDLVRECDALAYMTDQCTKKISSGVKQEIACAEKLGMPITKIILEQNAIYCIGYVCPKGYFFYEVDYKRNLSSLDFDCFVNFTKYGIYETKRGYHIRGKLASPKNWQRVWDYFKSEYPSDYAFYDETPQVLRTSPKFNIKGEMTSSAPKLVFGQEVKLSKKYVIFYVSEKS